MQHSMKMPDIGEGVVEAEIEKWHVEVGQQVQEDDPLVDVQTDKAIVEITAPVGGTIQKLGAQAGENIRVGEELVLIVTDAEYVAAAPSEPRSEAPAEPPPAPHPDPSDASPEPEPDEEDHSDLQATRETPTPPKTGGRIAPVDTGGRPQAAPAVRRRAREANIRLEDITPSSPKGIITHADIDAYLDGLTPGATVARRTGTRTVEVRGIRKLIAEKMSASKRSIPHYSYVEEVDITELESLRTHLNQEKTEHQTRLTYLPFIHLALVRALQKFPQCNATYDEERGILTEYDAVHLGVATMTDAGLMVPVLKHSETLSLWDSAAAIGELTTRAKEGKATPGELKGSTITLTSLGKLGGLVTTPVINAPEVAIIGVNKAYQKLELRDGEVEPRLCMNLSSSFDHRIVDGFIAASLIQAVKRLMEHPATLFI